MNAALLAVVRNPYAYGRVDSAWDAPPTDVRAIHQKAFDGCVRLVEEVAHEHQSHGAILYGQPGAGKTHALARVRRHVVDSGRGWFVYVHPFTGPDRFFRHVLQALAGDVLRPPHGAVTVSQLDVALARHVMADITAPSQSVASWWEEARARYPAPEALAAFLRPAMEPIAEAVGLDTQVVRVVIQLAARLHRPQARAWLLGRAITEEDCALLDVAESLDDEAVAEEAVVTLLSIAGTGFPVVLAFDQIEGLQRTPADNEGLIAFANGVARVFARSHNVVALTCAQINFLNVLRQAVGTALYDGRLAERGELLLAPLLASQVVELARQRAAAYVGLQQVRLVQRWRDAATPGVTDELWPLLVSDVEALATPDCTPRGILSGCRALFEQRRVGAPSAEVVPRAVTTESFDMVWSTAVERERQTPVDKIDEGVYVDGLIKAMDAAALSGVSIARSTIRDVDMVVASSGGRVGVSVCNAEHMTTLAARLRRLKAEVGQGRIDRLCVVRDARLPIKPTARATQEYLEQLQRAGATLSRPPVEAYVALAAIRNLLAEAAAGDLTLDGRTVEPQQLKDWLARNLPDPVADLIEEVTGLPAARAIDDVRERVLPVLIRVKVAELDTVAGQAEVAPGALRDLAATPGSGLGLIDGTPQIVFLHPDASEKS